MVRCGRWKYWHNYFTHESTSHMMTFGAGHDLYCSTGGSCYSNLDHDYNSPHGYGSGHSRSYLTGSYRWSSRNDVVEVYMVN